MENVTAASKKPPYLVSHTQDIVEFVMRLCKSEQHNETMAQKCWIDRYEIAFSAITYAEAEKQHRNVSLHPSADEINTSKEYICFTIRTSGRTSLS